MGLLSKITNTTASEKNFLQNENQKTGGLLSKASAITTPKFFSFSQWAKSNNFAHCAVFSPVKNMMVITHAHGIDSETIEKSVSTIDFWEGTLFLRKDNFENEIFSYTKSDKEFYNFLQFFSFEIKNSIENITFVKFFKLNKIKQNNNFFILMIFNTTKNSEIKIQESAIKNIQFENLYKTFNFENSKNDFINFSKSHFYNLLSINFQEIVTDSFNQENLFDANIKKIVYNSIYEQIFDVMKKSFIAPSEVSFSEYSNIKIAVAEISQIEIDLLEAHINFAIKNLLCKTNKKVKIFDCGKSNNADEIVSFLN